MTHHATFFAAAALAAVLTAATPAAAASTARASVNIPIFDGPSDRYAVIGTLHKNTAVELARCTRGARWCLFKDQHGDPVGWVRGSYLIGAAAISAATPFEFLSNPDFVPFP